MRTPPRAEPVAARPAAHPPAPAHLPRGVKIIFEDDHLLIVDKPPGLLTAQSPGAPPRERDALFDIVKDYVRHHGPRRPPRRDRDRDNAPPRHARQGAWIIHRLDKDVSGLLVFAKSLTAFEWLKQDFAAKRVHRLYTALVEGDAGPPNTTATIQSLLREDAAGNVRSLRPDEFRGASGAFARRPRPDAPRSGAPRPDADAHGDAGPGPDDGPEPARNAVTHYRVLAGAPPAAPGQTHPTPGMSLLQVRLETGRKNQIRVHLSERGHPIAGDRRFGAKAPGFDRVALHASELGFTHPATGQSVRFVSPAPAAWWKAAGGKFPGAREEPTPVEPTPIAPAPAEPTWLASTARPSPSPESGSEAPRAPVASGPSVADAAGPTANAPPPEPDTSWDRVAAWYDQLLSSGTSDHYERVIVPGTVRLVGPRPGLRVLDVACGQGVISRALAALGAHVVGVDAAPGLVAAAQRRGLHDDATGRVLFLTGDARALDQPALLALAPGAFDVATCVMALTNIEPLEPLLAAVAAMLTPGGRFVAVFTHPAFRIAGQTSWGWDVDAGRQYRRIDGYLSPGQQAIQMHPGKAARGQAGGDQITWTFHRPLQTYVRLLAAAGLLVETLEEWPAQRQSQPGPRAAEENRARREIPLFMALRCLRAPAAPAPG